jgi:hypothetical protein
VHMWGVLFFFFFLHLHSGDVHQSAPRIPEPKANVKLIYEL